MSGDRGGQAVGLRNDEASELQCGGTPSCWNITFDCKGSSCGKTNCQDKWEQNSYKEKWCLDDEELNSELLDTPEYKELMLLRKLEKEKLQELEDGFFKCYRCKSESINYCCTECKPPMSVNFCENCANQEDEIGQHASTHRLERIHHTRPPFSEPDYAQLLTSGYSQSSSNYKGAT
ncbi:ZZ-type zinc finger-containing protein 3 [Caerostris extrusa]|uniref:ZZ-type zinc finger-containing protein 3 n=1 Tax=Caerostris extrusa TaxID=172846 RepID=A0AAV4T7V5_CAEEX|nr:ZZ-type zinc finger-containing protein 3 [Caerostris extrusa]